MSEGIKTDLILKLKEIFRSDRSDLDFGIYRILNFKRKEIERFIEEELVKQAESEFSELVKADLKKQKAELDSLREEINRDFGEGTIDSIGEIRRLHDAPKIKRYSELRQTIDEQEQIKTQINEVFNHVYEFFSRYYHKGDFISQRMFGGREKYVIPHNGEEVFLYWANNDQYYVKSGKYFKKYSFKTMGYQVNFVLREAEAELNNIKDEQKYFLLYNDETFRIDEKKKELFIFFKYRALVTEEKKKYGTRNVQAKINSDSIKRLISKMDNGPGAELSKKTNKEQSPLEIHLKRYIEKNTADYFIHKNLKMFLERELEFYIKNEVLDLDEIENMDKRRIRLNKAKMHAIREISRKVIEFLAQIENFQKMLFEKNKFVIGTEYVITLDRVKEYAGEEFLESIIDEVLKNSKQIEEWKDLFKMKVKHKRELIEKQTVHGKEWKKLPIDTRHFDPMIKIRLIDKISEKNNLDEILDGVLIKSENLQALNLILPKYKKQVKCIYIDPPYNTGSDEFIYKDSYQHSSWLSMMADRLKLGMELLHDDGAIFISIDYNEMQSLRLLMQQRFGPENFRNTILFRRGVKSVQAQFQTIESLTRGYEYVLFHSKNPSARFKNLFKQLDEPKLGCWNNHWRGTDRPTMRYELFGKKPKSGQWRWSEDRSKSAIKNYNIMKQHFQEKGIPLTEENLDHWYMEEIAKTGAEKIDLLRYNKKNDTVEHYIPPRTEVMLNDVWFDISPYGSKILFSFFGKNVYDNPKPVTLIKRIVRFATTKDSIVLDFFAGSGTTAHATILLNKEDGGRRKFILVEMADYFDTIILPRLKKICYALNWRNGRPTDTNGCSGFFEYHRVEQYEDTLNNILFSDKDGMAQTTLQKLPNYFLQHVLDMETKDSPTRLTVDRFKIPFDYKIKTLQGREEKTEPVDLVETFNYLLGIKVKKIRQYENEQTKYIIVYGEKGEEPSCTKVLIIWRNFDETILEKEKQFIEEKILPQFNSDTIYVNVDSLIKGAESIEPKFKELMGA